jgi:hypothetical protein
VRAARAFVGLAALVAIACSSPRQPLDVVLTPAAGDAPALVRVTGLSDDELAPMRAWPADDPRWRALLGVWVDGTDLTTHVTGRYSVTTDAIEFRPRYPFDPGRRYRARIDPARLITPRADAQVERTFALDPLPAGPPTIVTGVSPGGQVWPENLLRFYIHFSAPMSRASALGHVRLEDAQGVEVKAAFLPLDVDLWNADHTRYTVFFDPGRVKRGIRPNVELGRAMEAGKRYAVVIGQSWPDGAGRPLGATYRYEFTAAAGIERAIDVTAWRVEPPPVSSRSPLTLAFPWALDHGLLQRAIGVRLRGAGPIAGEVAVGHAERTWSFTPRDPWRPGDYELVVLTLLEDPAGNRVNQPFEIEMLSRRVDEGESVVLPFTVK